MSNKRFFESARAAIEDAEKARQESVRNLATTFLRSGADFDPLALERLGTAGLAAFLDDVGLDIQTGNHAKGARLASRSKPPGNRKIGQMGWQALRRKEPVWGIRAIGMGIASGSSIAIIGALALAFTGN